MPRPTPDSDRCQNILPSGDRCPHPWDGVESRRALRVCSLCRDEANRLIQAAVAVIVAKATDEAADAA